MHDERFDRVGEIKDFEAAPGQRPLLDFSSRKVGLEPAHRVAGGSQPICSQRMAKGQGRKIRWPPIDRNWKGWRCRRDPFSTGWKYEVRSPGSARI